MTLYFWTLKFCNFVPKHNLSNETFATIVTTADYEQFTELVAIAYTEGEISRIM